MKNRLLYILFFMVVSIFLTSFNNSMYLTSGNNYTLFKIERSKDSNEIIYDINITSLGDLNTKNPVNIYWIKHSDSDKIKPLTWIQKKFAYGLEFLSIKETEAKFRFVSYSKRCFVIKKNIKGTYQVFTTSHNKEVAVSRIFIRIEGGTFWIPNIRTTDPLGIKLPPIYRLR